MIKKSKNTISFFGVLFFVLLIFIYPISKKSVYTFFVSVVSCFSFVVSICKHGKIKINSIVVSWLLSLIPILFNSYSIKIGEYGFTIIWVILILYMFSYKNTKDYNNIINVILFFSMIYIITTILFNITYFPILLQFATIYSGGLESGTVQVAGITSHYSHNAMYICIGLIIAISKYMANKNKKNLLYFCISLIALLLTQKRGPLLAVGIACIIFVILNYKEILRKRGYTVLFSGLAMLILIYIMYIIFPELFKVFERFKGDNLLTNRQYLWAEAWKMFCENPIFGIGWGGYIHRLNIEISSVHVTYMFCHNIYLQILAETGIVGLTILLYLMFNTLLKTIKLLKDKKDYIIYFSVIYQLFFLIYGISGNPLYDKQMLVPYFIAISYTQYIFLLEKEKEKNESWNNNI